MPATPAAEARRRFRLSLDTWAVIAAGTLVLVIVAGALPHVPW